MNKAKEKPPRSFHLWREKQGGVICFDVLFGDLTGSEWLESGNDGKPFKASPLAQLMIRSCPMGQNPDSRCRVVVLRGRELSNDERTIENVRARASHFGWARPGIETACLIRETIPRKELRQMGLHEIVVMHKPFPNLNDDLRVLRVQDCFDGYCLGTTRANPTSRLGRDSGFAFISQSD